MLGEARHSIFASLRTKWGELLVGRQRDDSTYGDYKAVVIPYVSTWEPRRTHGTLSMPWDISYRVKSLNCAVI